MKTIKKIVTVACFGVLSLQAQAERLVTIGPGVTEIVYALGQGENIVGADDASEITDNGVVKKVGYHRQLSSEGLLSLKLDHLIGTEDMGPPMVLEHLKKAGVTVTTLPGGYKLENLETRITELAKFFDNEKKGEALWQDVERQLVAASEISSAAIAENGKNQKVIYMMAYGSTPLIAGANTAADALINLAGAENAASTSFSGYKPVTAESLLLLAPDAIIVGNNALTKEGSADAILKMLPGIQTTPAGRNGRVITVDDTTLMGGLSPRIGDVALKLAQDIYAR